MCIIESLIGELLPHYSYVEISHRGCIDEKEHLDTAKLSDNLHIRNHISYFVPYIFSVTWFFKYFVKIIGFFKLACWHV